MDVPNPDRAEVDLRKLSNYCLSSTHPVAKHKAALFRAALGFTAGDAPLLRARILKAAVDEQAVLDRSHQFGNRYRLDFEIDSPSGRAWVRTAGIVRAGEDFPRPTTC